MVQQAEKEVVVKTLNINDLVANPFQPEARLTVPPDKAEELGLSIIQHGMIDKPVVRESKETGKFEVADGWQRIAGCRHNIENGHAEFSEILCEVRDLLDSQMAAIVYETNKRRRDLDPIQEAQFYKKQLEQLGLNQSELAELYHTTQGEISNKIRLLELPDDIKENIISQKITEKHGRQLLRLINKPKLLKKQLEELERGYYSANELSNRVQQAIYKESKPLDAAEPWERPKFDTTECIHCEHAEKIGSPYMNENKKLRCTNPECWKKKQTEAEKALIEKQKEECAAKGVERTYTQNELVNGTWGRLSDDFLEKHPECSDCKHRAGRKSMFDEIETVCIDIECHQGKAKKDREEYLANEKQKEQEYKKRIDTVVNSLQGEAGMTEAARVALLLSYGRVNHLSKLVLGIDLNEEKLDESYDIEEQLRAELNKTSLDNLVRILLQLAINQSYKGRVDPFIDRLESFIIGQPVKEPAIERIPQGVRQAHEVPDEECVKCKLTTADHTVDFKFPSPGKHGTYLKVCLKDYNAYLVKTKGKVPITILLDQDVLDIVDQRVSGKKSTCESREEYLEKRITFDTQRKHGAKKEEEG